MRRFLTHYLTVSVAITAVFFLYALQVDTNLSRAYMLLLAALSSSVSVLSIFLYVKVLRPRLDRYTATAVISIGLFLLGFALSILPSSCPTSPGSRCSVAASTAAGFSLMLLPVALAFLSLAFTTISHAYLRFGRLLGRLTGLRTSSKKSQRTSSGKSSKVKHRPAKRSRPRP